MKVILRLAFVESEKIDSMPLKVAKKYIGEKGIIGKVIIDVMVERDVARLSLVELRCQISSRGMLEGKSGLHSSPS